MVEVEPVDCDEYDEKCNVAMSDVKGEKNGKARSKQRALHRCWLAGGALQIFSYGCYHQPIFKSCERQHLCFQKTNAFGSVMVAQIL
jgi:hypothetical protein